MDSIKVTCAFFGGALIGVIATRTYFKSKYKLEAEDEIRQMRDYYKKKMDKLEKEETEEKPSSFDAFGSLVKDEEVKKTYVNYNTVNPEASLTKEEFDEMRERAMTTQHPEEEHDAPYVISLEEFEDGKPGYDSIGLSYYTEDQTLVDESEEILDVGEHVGVENIRDFETSYDDSMYIRNDQLGCDYEVIKVEDYFYTEDSDGDEE